MTEISCCCKNELIGQNADQPGETPIQSQSTRKNKKRTIAIRKFRRILIVRSTATAKSTGNMIQYTSIHYFSNFNNLQNQNSATTKSIKAMKFNLCVYVSRWYSFSSYVYMSFHCFYDRNKSISVLDTFFMSFRILMKFQNWKLSCFWPFQPFIFF
jgi:hypothetical protein